MEAPGGREAEDLVEWTCARAFLKDFVVRDTDFRRPGGDKREAADLLVVFGEEAIAFQVKHRPHPQKEGETKKTYYDRLTRKYVEKGAGQLNTFKRALEESWLTEVKNGRGLTIPINSDLIKRTRGIVVLHLPAEHDLPEDEKTVMYAGVQDASGMLVHAFLSDEFQLMLEELDTLPDFLLYLDFREQLYRAGKVAGATRNLDLLAAYRIHHDLRAVETQSELTHLVVEDGLWEHYLSDYASARRRKYEEDRQSYFIDRLIDERLAQDFAGFESTHGTDWIRTVYELARFTRVERRMVAERWMAAAERAIDKGWGYSCITAAHHPNEVVIVYAGPEQARFQTIELLASTAQVHFGVERVVVLATGPANQPSTLQTLRMEGRTYPDDVRTKLKAAAKKFFGPRREMKAFEFAPPERVYVNPYRGKSREKPSKPKPKKPGKRHGRNKRRNR